MNRCPACKSKLQKRIFSIKAVDVIESWKTKFDIDVSEEIPNDVQVLNKKKCANCGLSYWNPRTVAGSGKFYEKLQKFDWYYSSDKWEFYRSISLIKENDFVLEIGSGNGAFLKLCKSKTDKLLGTELNNSAINEANRRLGENLTHNYSFKYLKNNFSDKFNIVCSFQVLEHLNDVQDFFETAFTVLKKGGKLIIAVPNNNSKILRADYTILNAPPHHLNLFDSHNLKKIGNNYEFVFEEAVFEPINDVHIEDYLRGLERSNKIFKNVILNKIARILLEVRITRKYLSGHSLLMIFKK